MVLVGMYVCEKKNQKSEYRKAEYFYGNPNALIQNIGFHNIQLPNIITCYLPCPPFRLVLCMTSHDF